MLNKMRQSAGSWMIKILLGLVVLAFIFMGAGSFNSGRANKAATVNGEPISIKDYQQTYQRLMNRLRSQFGERLNNEMLEMMNVKKQAMNQVIETELLRQTAKKYDIRVASEELAESITQIPAFQKNGRFNQQQYKMVLNHNRLSPAAFEAMQRESMLVRKLQSIVSSGIQVSTAEVRQWYDWQNKKIKIRYAAFAPEDFTDVAIAPEALQTYYENHKDKYRTPPKRKARYVRFAPSAYEETVDVSDADIRAYYNDNKENFTQPATVKARHILLRVPQDASAEKVAEIREKAEKLMTRAKSGENFAELARSHSEGPTKEKGGDLGRFAKDEMARPFAEKAFAMAPGEISEPVRTRFGWHVIQVEDKTAESIQPLAEVADQIRETLSFQKAKDKAYEEAVAMYNVSFSGNDLIENSKDRADLSVQPTDFFTRQKGPEAVANASEFAQTAFKLPLMEISDVTEIGDAFYLIQTIEKQEAEIPEFEAVQKQVKKDLKQQKQKEAAEQAATAFLETVRAEGALKQAGQKAPVSVQTTDFFKRNQPVPDIGRDPALNKAAFDLSPSDPLPESPINGKKAYYVIGFAGQELPDEQAFEKNKDQVVQRLLQQKKRQFMDSWLAQLREKSDVEITRELLN